MSLIDMEDREFIIEIAKRIIPVKSISPASGGEGESKREKVLESILTELGYTNFTSYVTTDNQNFERPSLILKVGNKEKTAWIVSHIDTVPEGDPKLWTREPFSVTVEGNSIYGRGTSDDGQAVFLSMLLLRRIKERINDLQYNLGIAFVADEEVGSAYGIQFLLEKNIFKKEDLIFVPDAGSTDGMDIEIAEKSILWMKFLVNGKQYHASMPQNAVNANRDGMEFILQLDRMLHEKYSEKNEIFNYPYSTFEPTKHEKNVDNVNTIPGREVFYMDCRILPEIDVDHIIDEVNIAISDFEQTHQSRIKMELVQKEQAAIPTSQDSEVVRKLIDALRKRGQEPRIYGIGGGTCAAFFRRKGMNAVVWSTTVPEVAHQADEYCVIDHILLDADTFTEIIF
ncbi:MAG: M20 family metallo-hydrolase [Candidatus Thermoplasmatota archaeon]|jgi:succinyl-diaminopimelate desuccinylase|nr:M20 family metallo-hydrolase [Candidatus Thermoplasmatota archaeon]MCL5987832.1 M20 family metallo-hydrolase [Candidatus Thermoplasmatota archaeon]